MKVAVFSDVHGNLIALERFLDAVESHVGAYVCLGDVVDYGPWSNECVERVLALPEITLIEGNHERLFLGREDLADELPLVQDFFQHAVRGFSQAARIASLPETTTLGSYHCVHTIDGRSIYPDTDVEVDKNTLIGHSHHQFRIERSGFEIVNPGSIGQNRRWIDRVDFAIFDSESGAIELHSLPYDVDALLAELRSRSYPQACIEYYANKPRKGS